MVSASEEKDQPSRTVFAIRSPEREMKDAQSSRMKKPMEGFGEFLKTCFLCKNNLNVGKSDLYMYGYLGAFCSHECRNHQIALHGFDEAAAKEYSTRMKKAERNPFIQNACRLGG